MCAYVRLYWFHFLPWKRDIENDDDDDYEYINKSNWNKLLKKIDPATTTTTLKNKQTTICVMFVCLFQFQYICRCRWMIIALMMIMIDCYFRLYFFSWEKSIWKYISPYTHQNNMVMVTFFCCLFVSVLFVSGKNFYVNKKKMYADAETNQHDESQLPNPNLSPFFNRNEWII